MVKEPFIDYLKEVTYPTDQQRIKEHWDVQGIPYKVSNQLLKFDLRPLKNNAKGGSFKTKADKIVYDVKNQYVIIDVEEFHQYLKDNPTKVVDLEELISALEWNIILPK